MKKTSAKQRVLARLLIGPANTAELCQPDVGGIRFGARLLELRREGYEITERRLRAGSSLYTLVRDSRPAETAAPSPTPPVPEPAARLFDHAVGKPAPLTPYDQEAA